jgi:hypothetical protein
VPEQSYRSCQGILRLAEEYGSERMEAAALRAILTDVATYKSVKSILSSELDKVPLPSVDASEQSITHENIRGADYYRQGAAQEEDNA